MRVKRVSLGLAFAAWVALALAPAAASASPVLTYPTGTALASGSLLQITNIGVALFTEREWHLECPTAKFTGKLVTNSGSVIEIELSAMEIHGVGTGGDCRQDRTKEGKTETGGSVNVTYSGLPWCLRTNPLLGTDAFDIRGGTCGKEPKPATLTFNYTGLTGCSYETAAIKGTYTTHPGDAILSMAPELKGESSNSFLCAASMPSDTQMTVERDSLTAEPVYIS
jgi:hypothetical protein